MANQVPPSFVCLDKLFCHGMSFFECISAVRYSGFIYHTNLLRSEIKQLKPLCKDCECDWISIRSMSEDPRLYPKKDVPDSP